MTVMVIKLATTHLETTCAVTFTFMFLPHQHVQHRRREICSVPQ